MAAFIITSPPFATEPAPAERVILLDESITATPTFAVIRPLLSEADPVEMETLPDVDASEDSIAIPPPASSFPRPPLTETLPPSVELEPAWSIKLPAGFPDEAPAINDSFDPPVLTII